MPSAWATRPRVSASTPSFVSRSPAASTMSCWRRLSGTLEALRSAQPIADGAVEGHVHAPREAGDERCGSEQPCCGGGDQDRRAPCSVHGVVRGHGARVELAFREDRARAECQGEVRGEDARERRAQVAVCSYFEHRGGEQDGEGSGVCEAGECGCGGE